MDLLGGSIHFSVALIDLLILVPCHPGGHELCVALVTDVDGLTVVVVFPYWCLKDKATQFPNWPQPASIICCTTICCPP